MKSNLITLLPATKRLKQVIQEHGSLWFVLEDRPVQCFGGARGLFIKAGEHSRWVLPVQTEGAK